MTQLVINIPDSLATLLPATSPHATDPVWFDIARVGGFILVAIGVAWVIGTFAIGAIRGLQRVPKTPPRAKSQSFVNWLRYGGVNGVQRCPPNI
jgi:hypothetical protein